MAGHSQKTAEKKAEFYPNHLDWFVSKGIDVRLALTSLKRHEQGAEEYGKVLRRKSLKVCQSEMDGYLREYRAAESGMRNLAIRLSDPKLKEKFLSENKTISSEKYDSVVEGMRRKAAALQKLAWAYEKQYADNHGGPRQEYSAHLLVRDIARQLREEMEKNEGKIPASPIRRGTERPAFAQNGHAEPVSRETHALVSSYMHGLHKKYGEKPSEGEATVARAENSGYHRGYDRAGGQKYINIAALDRDEIESKYHRGERKIRGREELAPVMIARRSVPAKSDEEIAAGLARISTLKTTRTPLMQAQADIERVKKEREKLAEKVSSLSGAEKKKASEQLEALNKELYKLRKMRDSLV